VVRVLLAAVLAVLAAASNALASVGQRAAARKGPQHASFRLRMVLDLARRPVWWAGIAGVKGQPIFWPESLALVFFAASWLIKGEAPTTIAEGVRKIRRKMKGAHETF